jgi:predicted nucleotidyltransferase
MVPPQIPDLPSLAKSLNSNGVDYIVLGGLAVMMHGGDTVTNDADISVAVNKNNLDRLVAALAPLNPRPLRLAPGAAWEFDIKCIRGPWTLFMTDVGRVDLVFRFPEPISYAELRSNAVDIEVEGVKIQVMSIQDLIRIKEQTGRDKDQVHVHILRAILSERERLMNENG